MVTRNSALLAATLLLHSIALSQTPSDAPAPAPPGATVLQTNARVVILDVVVQDASGKPIHGLKPANFVVTESKTPETLRHVEEHVPPPPSAARGPELGPMPPGTFTDYTPIEPGSTLNVLLLDALNTPTLYQTWVRDQLKKYMHQAPAGQRIAIFGLTDHLILLQGFTSDPATLQNMIDRKLSDNVSPLLSDPVGSGSNTQDLSDDPSIAASDMAANLRQFEREEHAVEAELRVQTTLDAFNAIAHYLGGFQGRKNLIWFSGSFPTGIFGNPTASGLLNASYNGNAIQQTATALSAARVAVYPIDARGLMVDPSFNASNSNPALAAGNSHGAVAAIHAFSDSQAEEHATMDTLAAETGGRAFYNTNGIVQAVNDATSSGANYYTLTYTPADRNWNGAYRNIKVKLVDAPPDLKLTYRPGYYAVTPKQPRKVEAASLNSGPETQSATPPSDPNHLTNYDRTVLTRGAPAPQDVLFKVRVLPSKAGISDQIVAGNALSPNDPAKGPFRRYDVDYALQPGEVTFNLEPNGVHATQIKFTIYVYDRDGKLLVSAHRGFNLNLKPDFYAQFMKAILQCHMEISVPDRTETFLRIAVQDIASDRFGVVEFPTASVRRLPPPVYGPATKPPSNASPISTPSTPNP
jgi:VWFA-related protein